MECLNISKAAAASLHLLSVVRVGRGPLGHAGEPRVGDGPVLDGAHHLEVLLQLHAPVVVRVDLPQDP